VYTGKFAQLVVMCIQPGDEIGNEVHPAVDQFFRIEKGEAKFVFEMEKKNKS
jgi:mannose-6-phosphate isomerase-like protein (cupin superfamily)